MVTQLFDSIFRLHPVLAVVISAALVALVGCFELYFGKSRREAYITWGVAGISLTIFFILRLLGS